jgi:hypothetical protein
MHAPSPRAVCAIVGLDTITFRGPVGEKSKVIDVRSRCPLGPLGAACGDTACRAARPITSDS